MDGLVRSSRCDIVALLSLLSTILRPLTHASAPVKTGDSNQAQQ